MEFELVIPKKYLEKIIQQLKQKISVPKDKTYLGADEIERTKPAFQHSGVACWIIRPPILTRKNDEYGFDFYVSDGHGHKSNEYPMAEILAGFNRVEKNRYKKVRSLYLQNSDEGFCNLYLKFFARRFLCKRLKYIIEMSKKEIYYP